ncbi:MAG: putative amidohydrolase [Gammaproteobacteria bacterium]|jgi:predicted amidohydrolase
MRIGIYQSALAGLTPVERLAKLETTLATTDLDLVVCPELFMSGYNVGDALTTLAEPIDGSYTSGMIKLATNTRTAIVFGYPELAGTHIYNSALCVDAQGEIVANHRKLLLPPGFESDYFSSGDNTTIFELGGMKCAILVCYDVEYPEAVRAVAELGAQLVIVPTALGDGWGIVTDKLIPTRAFENGVWLVYANHAGVENGLSYYGGSCIVAPNGSDKARASSIETLISASIDIESVGKAQARLPYLHGVKQLRKKLAIAFNE